MSAIEEVDVDEFLAHFGVKGMKWGKRNSQPMSTQTKRRVLRSDRLRY